MAESTTDLTDQEIAEIMRERARNGAREDAFLDVRADAVLALKRVLDALPPASRQRGAELWLQLITHAEQTGETNPTAFPNATTPEAFLAAVSGVPAALSSSATNAPTTTAANDVLVTGLNELADAFGMDPLAFLQGPGEHLVRIANQDPDNVNALLRLLANVAQANTNSPYRLQRTGALLANSTAEHLVNELAKWKPCIDALETAASSTEKARRKAAMIAAANGDVHPDIAAKDAKIAALQTRVSDQDTELTTLRRILEDLAKNLDLEDLRSRGRDGVDVQRLVLNRGPEGVSQETKDRISQIKNAAAAAPATPPSGS